MISRLTIKKQKHGEQKKICIHLKNCFLLNTGLIWKETLRSKQLQNVRHLYYTNIFLTVDVSRSNPELHALPNVICTGALSKQI